MGGARWGLFLCDRVMIKQTRMMMQLAGGHMQNYVMIPCNMLHFPSELLTCSNRYVHAFLHCLVYSDQRSGTAKVH